MLQHRQRIRNRGSRIAEGKSDALFAVVNCEDSQNQPLATKVAATPAKPTFVGWGSLVHEGGLCNCRRDFNRPIIESPHPF
jgi:hypothetical protein